MANGIVHQMHRQNAVVRLEHGACETRIDASSTRRRRIGRNGVVCAALAAASLGEPAIVVAAPDCLPAIPSPGVLPCPPSGALAPAVAARPVDLHRFGLRPRADGVDPLAVSTRPVTGEAAVKLARTSSPGAEAVAGADAGAGATGAEDGQGVGSPGDGSPGDDSSRDDSHGEDAYGEDSDRGVEAGQVSATPGRSAAAALERLLLDGRDSDDNDFVIGVASSAGPSYSGASDTTYSVRPAARLTWRGYSISTQSVARASARVESTSGGERTGFSGPLRVRNRFSFGFGATINRGRDVSAEGAALGLKSLPSTVFGRLRLRYALDERTSLSATLIGDVLNRQRNIELPMSIGRHYVLSDRMLLGLNAGMNLVNRRSMDNDYGIGPEQSAASGRPIYQPKAGLREFAVSATLIHEPDNHWIWMTQFSLVRLVGEAARSPLVRQKLQPNLMFGLAYRISWD